MIPSFEAIKAIHDLRGDAVVVGTMTPNRYWDLITDRRELDLPIFGAMGKASSLALGLTLARPDKNVLVLDGDGALLMNLGSLVTTAGQLPKNFYHFLLDNESYATTGGQPVPNAQNVDYEGLARESGYASVCSIDDLEKFAGRLPEILDGQGPVFVAMKIVPEIENVPVGLREFTITRTAVEVICDLREELGVDGE